MKVLVTGGNGFVGKNLQQLLEKDENEWIFTKRGTYGTFNYPKRLDLQDLDSVFSYFDFIKPDVVVHLAARVGGVKENKDHNFDFMMENLEINKNVLKVIEHSLKFPGSFEYKIKHFIPILSTCVYPDKTLMPSFKDFDEFNDRPLRGNEIEWGMSHESNNGYAYAKKLLYLGAKMLREMYGLKSVCLVPNNLFGAFDNFDLDTSHVLPALIRKSSEGKFKVWGNEDQPVFRNFTYATDFVKIIKWAVEHQIDEEKPLIVGNPEEHPLPKIVQLLEKINDVEAKWDGNTTYQGQVKKPINNDRFQHLHKGTTGKQFNYQPFEDALRETNEWFKGRE